MTKFELMNCARGKAEVDTLLENCKLIDVLSGSIRDASVAISDGFIVGLDGKYRARKRIDLNGKFVASGLIDSHVHIESSLVSALEFARAVLVRGTTAIVTDLHEIANVMGVRGIRYIISAAKEIPLDFFIMLPSCVPATSLETSGATLEADDLRPLIHEPSVIGLGEVMNFPGTISQDPSVIAKIKLFEGKPIDGHAPGLTGEDLSAYILAGPESDHECTTPEEAFEKLGKGMYIYLREGTGARNVHDLLPLVNSENSSRFCLCTDDRSPFDLLNRGHVDSIVAMLIQAGISPVTAVQMATLNPARRFLLRGRGAIAPGYVADIIVVDDLEKFSVTEVFKDGRLVVEDGIYKEKSAVQQSLPQSTFRVKGFSIERLKVAEGERFRVIGVVPGQIVTESNIAKLPSEDGFAIQDTANDILKVAVVERHHGTGNVGVGFVRGFGLKRGALASSVAHDSHNIVVVGASDEDMVRAVERVVELSGGQVVVADGKVHAELALPIAGLMSMLSIEDAQSKVEELKREASRLGCILEEPFMAMSFLALPVIPSLKITDKGLVDVGAFKIVELRES